MPLPQVKATPLDPSLFTDETEWYSQLANGQVVKLLLGDIKTYILDGVVGGGGGGGGDMFKATYDADNDGISDRAELADSVEWANILNRPALKPAFVSYIVGLNARFTGVTSQVTYSRNDTTGVIDIALADLNSASEFMFISEMGSGNGGTGTDRADSDGSLTINIGVTSDAVNTWDSVAASINNDLYLPKLKFYDLGVTLGGLKEVRHLVGADEILPDISWNAGVITFRLDTANFTSRSRVLITTTF